MNCGGPFIQPALSHAALQDVLNCFILKKRDAQDVPYLQSGGICVTPASVAAWRQASAEFAQNASGNVMVLQADAVRTTSVWAEVESPALKANPNVTSINWGIPETGEGGYLWSR